MRTPKGFGKNYYTLSAIQAYSTEVLLQQCETRVHAEHLQISEECDDEMEEELDELLCTSLHTQPVHGGHCSCYYDRITRNHILENSTARLLISTYKFSNSVSSPPWRISTTNTQTILRPKRIMI